MDNLVFIDGKIEDQGEIVEYMKMRDERLNKKAFATYADFEMVCEALNKWILDYEELKVELAFYKKAENEREKEFRELEREVYNLKQRTLSPMSRMTQSMQAMSEYKERRDSEAAILGQSCLT